MTRPFSRTAGAAMLAAAGVAAFVAAVAAPVSAGAAGSSGATYYKIRPACPAARPGFAQCFALQRIAVASRSAGAHRAAALPADLPVGPNGGFTPGDLATAYTVNPAAATTQTVGIVDAYDDPNARADLNQFDAHYGLPAETATSFRKVSQAGTTTYPDPDPGWAAEESLDLDAVRGLCRHCKIILVEANSSSFQDLASAENRAVALGATIVSNSYGGAESGALSTSQRAAYNHPGVVITVSTGDDGYFDWDYFNYNYGSPPPGAQTQSSNAPQQPASLNTVVAVGGTTLQLNDNGTRAGESVWNENGTFDNTGYYAGAPQGASGGGCSTVYAAAKWQSSVAGYNQTACGTKRLPADVSALADPNTGYDIYDTYQSSGWQTYGGTSLAAPLTAAMWALAGGSGGIKYPALSLYGHSKTLPSALYDVTVGGNSYCDGTSPGECGSIFSSGSPNGLGGGILDCAWDANGNRTVGTRACEAATGYDGPSGVGTPRGLSTFMAMHPYARETLPGSLRHGVYERVNASTSSDPFPGGVISSCRWTWGDGTSAATTCTTGHRYARAGHYTITLSVTDNYGVSSSTSRTVTVS